MEVHHHAHTSRKKWTHYFWEFLMLFLAVFCGFLAENQREHYIEHQREKHFMKTLLQDLKNDTTSFSNTIRIFQNSIDRVDSLKSFIKNPATPQAILNSYKAATLVWRFGSFNYSDRTIEQLKSAGNFRLIRNSRVSDTLIEYDKYIRNLYMDIEEIIIRQNLQLGDIQNEIFDYDIYHYLRIKNWEKLKKITTDSINYPLKLIAISKEKLQYYYNSLGICRDWWQRFVFHSGILKNSAVRLIALIKKEYHLK